MNVNTKFAFIYSQVFFQTIVSQKSISIKKKYIVFTDMNGRKKKFGVFVFVVCDCVVKLVANVNETFRKIILI